VEALVVNRLYPRFGEGRADEARARAESLAGTPLAGLYQNLADFRHVAEREERHFGALAAEVSPAPVARVPFLAADVHDLDGLVAVGKFLFAES
jgi:hypothetical protein